MLLNEVMRFNELDKVTEEISKKNTIATIKGFGKT
ncbi:hypothetical protein [Kordia sp.]